MLKSILAAVKHRLVEQIIVDYLQWARAMTQADSSSTQEALKSKVVPSSVIPSFQ